jgi:hypothetical protein
LVHSSQTESVIRSLQQRTEHSEFDHPTLATRCPRDISLYDQSYPVVIQSTLFTSIFAVILTTTAITSYYHPNPTKFKCWADCILLDLSPILL